MSFNLCFSNVSLWLDPSTFLAKISWMLCSFHCILLRDMWCLFVLLLVVLMLTSWLSLWCLPYLSTVKLFSLLLWINVLWGGTLETIQNLILHPTFLTHWFWHPLMFLSRVNIATVVAIMVAFQFHYFFCLLSAFYFKDELALLFIHFFIYSYQCGLMNSFLSHGL